MTVSLISPNTQNKNAIKSHKLRKKSIGKMGFFDFSDLSVASRQLPYLRGASEGHWDLNSSLYDVVDLIAD